MKRIIFRLSILLLTFAIGFSIVRLSGLFIDEFSRFVSPPKIAVDYANTSHQEKPRFIETYRACGIGYYQGYETDDGQQLGESNAVFNTRGEANAKFNNWIAKAARVIERVSSYKNHYGDSVERVVLVNPAYDKNSKESVSILYYDGGQFIKYIEAPSLELALEFEEFLRASESSAK